MDISTFLSPLFFSRIHNSCLSRTARMERTRATCSLRRRVTEVTPTTEAAGTAILQAAAALTALTSVVEISNVAMETHAITTG